MIITIETISTAAIENGKNCVYITPDKSTTQKVYNALSTNSVETAEE